ncbi:50s ribosomal l4 [Pyrenophora seminiperda CCB06]|uniref:Large ribosomal subunit protein uL29m n=1 Tax=Pyrenophora seminiperda CCB06 TaxID=1302712 RepID=A0A3M7MGC4_9PLEO|nr:50s ribosomal l4 [Pyrenophora seminiperda CCB06]
MLSRWKRDNNKNRGTSAVRATGLRPRQTLSVRNKDFAKQELPKPVKYKEKVTGTPDHGLWDFFKNKQLLQTPMDEQSHGRSWTIGELRSRDWDSLHQLWWICVKERNRLATEKIERNRIRAGYGDVENEGRDKTVQETMKAILDTLAERHQAYQEAFALAQQDPEIDLAKTDGPQYTQVPYDALEEDETIQDAPQEPIEPIIEVRPSDSTSAEPEARPKDKTNYA